MCITSRIHRAMAIGTRSETVVESTHLWLEPVPAAQMAVEAAGPLPSGVLVLGDHRRSQDGDASQWYADFEGEVA
jgi:hypothetical protein